MGHFKPGATLLSKVPNKNKHARGLLVQWKNMPEKNELLRQACQALGWTGRVGNKLWERQREAKPNRERGKLRREEQRDADR